MAMAPRSSATRWLLIVAMAALSATCNRRDGMNFSCQWADAAPFPLDLGSESHVQHLMDDIRVADELAIRYGDRLAGWRLIETYGIVSRHGGVKNRDAGHKARQECTASLVRAIGSTHAVTEADINGIRPQLLERGADLPITVPTVVLLVFAVRRFTRWLRTRFDATERLGWLVATLMGSLAVPLFAVVVGGGWAMVVEILRVGNEHMAHRARTESLKDNLLVLFVVGVGAVWIASATVALKSPAEATSQRPPSLV